MQAKQSRAVEAVQDTMSKASLGLAYAAVGAAGLMLWLLVQLPVGARAKEMLVYSMAGCIGTVTLGWHLLRSQRTR